MTTPRLPAPGSLPRARTRPGSTRRLRLDEKRRHLLQHAESLKSKKNQVSNEVARRKSKGEDAAALITEMRAVADEIKGLDEQLKTVEEELRTVILQIPNIPHPSVPPGGHPRTTCPWPRRANRP